MAEPANIYSKLVKARNDFYSASIKKSGKNDHAEFLYYELGDIVPTALKVLTDNGLLFNTSFPDGKAFGNLINIEKPEEAITFCFDTRPIAEPAKFRMNETQARGAELTYMRRYLYMLLFDIVEHDAFDEQSGKPTTAPTPAPAPEKKAPATPEKRKETVKTLTEGNADATQIKGLATALAQLKKIDPSKQEFIDKIKESTNGLKEISAEKCTALTAKVSEMIANYGTGEAK